MRRRKRQTSVFSLAFLDVMSCGFGAIVLIFLIVNNKTEAQPYDREKSLTELRLLDFEKLKGQRELSELEKNARKTQMKLNSAEAERSALQNDLTQLIEELERIKGSSVAEIEATGDPMPFPADANNGALEQLIGLPDCRPLEIGIADTVAGFKAAKARGVDLAGMYQHTLGKTS